MTEAEWLVATDPAPMLEFLCGKVSDRKLRLFCLLCCEPLSQLFDERGLAALNTAERFIEDLATPEDLQSAWNAANEAFCEFDDSDGRESAANAVRTLCSD